MSNGSHGAQQLKDRIVQSRVHDERDRFISSIREEDVRRLASSHHNKDSCSFFKPPKRGSYNICYFVHFASDSSKDGEKWVIRVPLAPCLAYGSSAKLESEIASMQLVAEKTTIPVPKIFGYCLNDGPEPLSSYIILEYIEGQMLSHSSLKTLSDEQRECFYTSLSDIYIQLRRLEFPSIGCLARGIEGYEVRNKIVTMDLNMQELERLRPSVIRDSFYHNNGRLTSASDYIKMLLQIADNAFLQGRNSVCEEVLGGDLLYHLHIFREYTESWVDSRFDLGPFILVHGDLELFNLVVNEKMEIISVLDWEWSRVVPLQLFKPPLWLRNPDTTKLAYNFVYDDYLKSFNQLLAIVRARERERYGNELLADEWTRAKNDSGFLVANALENWTDMDWFANRYINRKRYGGKTDLPNRIKAFMEEDPTRKALISKKIGDGHSYKAEVDRLRSRIVEEAPEYKPVSAFAIIKEIILSQLWNDIDSFTPTVLQLALGSVVIISGTLYLLVKRNPPMSFSVMRN